MKRYVFFLLLFLLLNFGATGFADEIEDAYQKDRAEYHNFLINIPAQKVRSNWTTFIQRFLQFAADHPQHERSGDSLFIAADAYCRMGRWSGRSDDFREAVKVYDRLVRSYPDSRLADDAMIKAANIFEKNLNEPTEAYNRYFMTLENYAEGDQADVAAAGVARLADSAPTEIAEEAEPTPAIDEPATPIGPTAEPQNRQGIREIAPMSVTEIAPPSTAAETVPIPEPQPVKKSQITGIEISNHYGVVRFTVSLSSPTTMVQTAVQPSSGSNLQSGLQLFFQNADLAQSFATPQIADNLLQSLTVVRNDSGVAIDLKLAPFASFQLIREDNPPKITVEIRGTPQTNFNSLHRKKIVVLDPGHGGEDFGAQSNSLIEKDIVLAVAQLVKQLLEANGNVQVMMTRDADHYLPLDVRTAMANDARADLFASIHVNWSYRPVSNGVETYVFSPDVPHNNGETVSLENKPGHTNASTERETLVRQSALYPSDDSYRFAQTMQRSLLHKVRSVNNKAANRGVKSSPFFVLMDATMPAVIVEIGFASNSEEEKRLIDPDYQQLLAVGIADGILAFLNAPANE